MKTKLILLLTVLAAVFRVSMANAQLIYSNNFSLGAAVNISNTPPTVANTYAGGTNTATWNDVAGVNDTGTLQANGVDNTAATDSWLLPFVPQTNHVYLLTATVTFTNSPGNWIGVGFAQTNPFNTPLSIARFSDTIGGYDWAILTENTGNVQYFAGAKTANGIYNANNAFPPGPGTETIQLLLNTQPSQWSIASYINGVEGGTNYTYATNTVTFVTNGISVIQAVGLTQTALTAPTSVQWNNFSLATTLLPFVVNQPIAAQTVSGGFAYTNKVSVMADTNGGPLSYQWYAGGLPLANSASISGANTNVLIIKPALTPNQFTNYYVVVNNNYGSATSSLASLTVLTNPVVTFPANPNNMVTLFGGGNVSGTSYVGASPVFSVTAIGAQPLFYQWLTNGVVVGGATNGSLAFTNLQTTGPTSFVCVVSNSYATTTDSWSVTYAPAPEAAYPQAVLTDGPVDFWRLNEPDDGLNDGNNGAVCHDYSTGNNGIYTNTALGNAGYNSAEPTETSAFFGKGGKLYSYVGHMQNVDFALTNGGNAEFSVEAWVNCFIANGAPAVAQGVYGVSDAFDLGMDTNAGNFQFYIRSAAGTVYKADSSIYAADGNWHHLVGVCDQANTNVTLYVDGQAVASTGIPAKSGLFEANAPIVIGAGNLPASGYNLEFSPYIADVATYNHALSDSQVISQYAAIPGNTVPIGFVTAPPTTFVYLANQTLTIPAIVAGSGPLGFYWTDLTTGNVLTSGQTNNPGSLNATFIIPNAPASLSGDQLQLTATNATSSVTAVVTLFSPPPPVALDYSSPILYSNSFNGGTYSIGGLPLTAVNSLEGGTNAVWVDALGTNDTGSLMANGTDATTLGDSWLLPFYPQSGYIYTLTTSLTFSGNPGSWVGPGFAQSIPTNAAAANGRFTGLPVQGYDWMILTEANGQLEYFAGPNTGGTITNKTPFFTAGVATHNIQMVLDTTSAKWKVYGFVDGVAAGTNIYASNPPIGAVGVTQNALTAPNFVKWNSFSLTQVALTGVPPYPLAPIATNATLLADASLSIPVTIYGSAPFGYTWSDTNTGAILASGANNTMSPLNAGLTIADVPASWNGNTLELVLTNAFGTNIYPVTLTVTSTVIIPTNSASLTGFTLSGGGNVVINANNGQTGGTYYLLSSTNLITPLSQWLPVATNVITTNGAVGNGFTFTGTNVMKVGTPQQFYILSNTN